MTTAERMLSDLARSGLDADDASKLSMRPIPSAFGAVSGYRIPYFEVDGEVNGFHRDRLFDVADKYKQPPKTAPRLYLPPLLDWTRVAVDTSVALIVTEGEKKAAAACKHGFPTVGVGGVWSWMVDHKPIVDLDAIKWLGRSVTIAYDSDAARNDKVVKARDALAAELRRRGAKVGVAELPDDGAAKVGLDDYLVARGAEALRALLATSGDEKRVVYQRMDEIMAEPINWLWPDRIARGKLNLVVGDPGLGKSQITINIMACVTTGRPFPDGTTSARGNVVVLSAEDDAADTLKPRLAAAGADMSKIYVLQAVLDDSTNGERSFNLGRDIPRLDEMLTQIGGAALVTIDPISAYLGDVDSHRNSEVRALLMPLSSLAAKHATALIGVTHLNKSGNTAALQRVTGSLAFVAAARAAYLVVEDKNDPARRLFLPLKNNIGKSHTGFAYTVQGRSITLDGKPHDTSHIVWEKDSVEMSADDALEKPKKTDSTALNAAQEFLMTALASGPVAMKQLEADASGAGHSWATVRRAKSELGIEAVKEPGEKGRWMWSLRKAKF